MANKIPVKAIYTGTDVTALGEYASTDTIDSTYLDTGTSANQIVQLDGTAKLPAVDGSNLTNMASGTPEGTAILSTGETGGTKYLREDGDGTCSWQAVAGGGIGEFIGTGFTSSIAVSENDTALALLTSTNAYNVAIGGETLFKNVSGWGNVAIGLQANRETTSNHNIAIGQDANRETTTTASNIAIGYLSNRHNRGTSNIGVGESALRGASTPKLTGSYNSGIGYQTGYNLTTGQYNVLNGYQAGYSLTSGSNNVFFGVSAGKGQTGSSNIAIGENSMLCAAGGSQSYNIALGRLTGAALTTGANNTILGQKAGQALTSGYNNVLIGENAGNDLTTHFNNVLIGNDAGATLLDSNKLHIANNATESLIEGDFAAKTVNINGALTVNGAAVGGAMELISTTNVTSSVASVEVNGITGYDSYQVVARLTFSVAAEVRLQLGNASVFETTGYRKTGSTLSYLDIQEAAREVGFTEVSLSGLTLAEPTLMRGQSNSSTIGTDAYGNNCYGTHETLTAYSALKFYSSSGTIDSGTISIYGIKS